MATAAHSYLMKLPRGKSGGNEREGAYFVRVFVCDYVLTAVVWVVLDNRGVMQAPPPRVMVGVRRRRSESLSV